MLRSFRENIKGTFGKVLLAIIIIPFVGFGAADLITGRGQAPAILSVNDIEVDEIQFVQELNMTRNEIASRMGPDANYSELTEDKIAPIVKQRFIQRMLLEQFSEAIQINVPSRMLEQQIVKMEEFHIDGKFSNQQMQMLLASSGLNLNALKMRIQNDLRQQQLTSGIGASGFASKKDIELIATLGNESRVVDWVQLQRDSFKAGIEIDEAAINDYYQANQQQYQTELMVDAEYILLSLEDFRRPVSDEEVAEEYARRAESFEVVESRRAEHILLELSEGQDEAAARERFREIGQRLAGGESFAELAREYSQDTGSASDGGDLGVAERDGSFPAAFEEALFSLAEGEVSEPVQTDAGLHIIRASEITRPEMPALAAIRDEIVDQLQRANAQQRYIQTKEELADLVFNADGLSEPAASLGLDIASAAQITRGASELAEFTEPVLAALFSTEVIEEGLNSELIELDANRSIVVAVKQSFPPRTREFDEVRSAIQALLVDSAASETVQQLAGEFIEHVAAGESFSALAEARGYALNKASRVTRQTTEVAASVLDSVFAAPRSGVGKSVHRVVDPDGDLYLYQLVSVDDGEDFITDEILQVVGNQAPVIIARQELSALLSSLRQAADIQEF